MLMSGTPEVGPDRGPANPAGAPRDWAAPGRLALVAAGLGCVVATACTAHAVPTERWYVDQYYRVYDLTLMVIHDIGGEVVTENRPTGSITGSFPEEIAGHVVYIDVTIERRSDESWVRADTRAQSASVTREDLELWRQRFFDALDSAAAQAIGTPIGHGQPTPSVPRLP